MLKKVFSSIVILSSFFMPIFWVEVRLPNDQVGDDINITTQWQMSNTRIRGDEKTLFNTVNLVNNYLRWSFTIVCTILVIYGGFELITANGDKKALKRAQWTFIGTWVWIAIAMLSYAIVRILSNIL